MEIVTGSTVISAEEPGASSADAGSPFLPKPPNRNNKKK